MLITNKAELLDVVKVSDGLAYNQMKPFLRQARMQYVRPVLGPEFLLELEEYMQGSASHDSAAMDAVLAEARQVEGLFAMYLAIPVLQLKMESTGLHALSNSEYKSPYQWQVGDYRESYMLAAYAAVEELYNVLMQHRADPMLSTWLASTAYAGYNKSILRSATEFSQVLSIGYSHITFSDLKPAIRRAEDLVLRKELGDEFYDELVAYVVDGESSESDAGASDLMALAVDKLRPVLAHLAVGESREILWKVVNGSLLSSRYDGNSSTDVKVIDDRLHQGFAAAQRKNAHDMGMELLAVAKGWLDRNADDLPSYKNGPGYRPAGKDERPVTDRMHNASGMMMM